MRNVFGKYLPNATPLHFVDARLKILLTVLIITMTFLSQYLVSSLILLLLVMVVYGFTIKRIKPFFTLLITPILVSLFVFAINIFTREALKDAAGEIIVGFPNYVNQQVQDQPFRVVITYQNIMDLVSLIIRIYTIILVTSLLTYTTKQIFLTKAIEFWIYPLKLLFIPVEIISMIISLALRFIPTLLEEANRIMKAQASRGVDFKNGRLKEKAKALITLIVPLFVTSFNKAEDLAYAMETRGYNPYKARSKYRKLSFKYFDYLIFIFFVGLLVYFILMNIAFIQNQVILSEAGKIHNYISFNYFISGFNNFGK
ncbi:energy-coupling factor transport system permease protein [Mycoplasma testudineum]|uniref:Energy-coupling factor transport system permease protein n=2 Tax=Mycoplasma testudineum TaxID=244584 RepID=A0A4R6IH47_9MOLU|nr:energy-coupling factor transporter transmembrane component T [Mycoplasma testudineum]OYD27187.1 cobalt ABC transporter permease [Mycoplasma testudineum]TDO21138.1 energy-coupling factor transport system permease protein [Mycoplasma testudineum]